MPRIFEKTRLDAWYDGSAICIIAVSDAGDPLDLGEDEVKDFIAKLQALVVQAEND